MALKATWVDSAPDTTGKAQELKDRGMAGLCENLHRHWYTVTGPKEEVQLYIDTVSTESYTPVSDDGTITFSTLFPSITDECTLYRSRKVNPKTGTHNYTLKESEFTRLSGQLNRVKNGKLQDILINAKAHSVMGIKPSTATAQAMDNALDDILNEETPEAKPKAKAKVNPESEAE